jgi:hypothetical protein
LSTERALTAVHLIRGQANHGWYSR